MWCVSLFGRLFATFLTMAILSLVIFIQWHIIEWIRPKPKRKYRLMLLEVFAVFVVTFEVGIFGLVSLPPHTKEVFVPLGFLGLFLGSFALVFVIGILSDKWHSEGLL